MNEKDRARAFLYSIASLVSRPDVVTIGTVSQSMALILLRFSSRIT